ncbi:MAG: ATP-binding cassette domain-containing protein [Niameybacter sp.]
MIQVKGLLKKYDQGTLYENFDIEFESGKVSVLLGASGSGKTTLIRILLGFEKYEKGYIIGLEKEKISVVFQENRLIKWMSVYENIELVLKSYLTVEEQRVKIKEVLELVELWEYRGCQIDELSGGMQRRIALARALAYKSKVLILDEPFKGQDYALKIRLMKKMKKMLQDEPRTTLFITHDMEEAHFLGEELYILRDKPVKFYKI